MNLGNGMITCGIGRENDLRGKTSSMLIYVRNFLKLIKHGIRG